MQVSGFSSNFVLPVLPGVPGSPPGATLPPGSRIGATASRSLGRPQCAPPRPPESFLRRRAPTQTPPRPRTSCFLLCPRLRAAPDYSHRLSRHKQPRSHRPQRYSQNSGELGIGLPFHLAQPQQRPLLLWEPPQRVGHERSIFRPASGRIVQRRVAARVLMPPPFSRALACDAVEITAQSPVFRLKPVGPPPNLGECFLHNVFRALPVADGVPQKRLEPWRVQAIKRLKRIRVSPANLLPKLWITRQSLLHSVIRACTPKGSS